MCTFTLQFRCGCICFTNSWLCSVQTFVRSKASKHVRTYDRARTYKVMVMCLDVPVAFNTTRLLIQRAAAKATSSEKVPRRWNDWLVFHNVTYMSSNNKNRAVFNSNRKSTNKAFKRNRQVK